MIAKLGTGCFGLLALLSLSWVCMGAAYTSSTVQQLALTPGPTYAYVSQADAKQISRVVGGITGGLGVGFFACTGLPAAAVFGAFMLVCFSSWQSDRRHQEILAAERLRNDILGNMALVQMAQAQMQYNDGSQKRKREHYE